MRKNGARLILLLVVGPLLAAATAACSTTELKEGDCARQSSDGYVATECTGSALRILAIHQDTADRCTDVPGVTNSYSGRDQRGLLCLGPFDASPASAVNVAKAGDCLTDTANPSTVRKVTCSDRAAKYRVVKREDNGSVMAGMGPCRTAPGATSSYAWSLRDDSPLSQSVSRIAADIVFCLGPAGVDPATSVDLARAGDCLRETGAEPSLARVDCGSAQAGYRVTRRVDNSLLEPDTVCAGDASLRKPEVVGGYILCLSRR